MFRKAIIFAGVIGIVLLFGVSVQGYHPRAVHGEILDILPEQGKVRLMTNRGMLILELELSCLVFRGGQNVTLESVRPIQPGWYQDGIFLLNSSGRVVEVFVNYNLQEEAGFLISYDIFGEIKIMEPLD